VSGRDDLAQELEGGETPSTRPRSQSEAMAEAARRQAGQDQEFLDHLRGKLEEGWTSIPGLLHR
jgi:hypothetical protein